MDRACDSLQPVPDLGYYTPVRVCDGCVGVESCDGCEDVVVLCARRTELVCAIQQLYSKTTGGADLAIQFSNSIALSSAGCGPSSSPSSSALSRHAAPELVSTDAAKSALFVPGFGVSVALNGSKIVIAAPAGLPHDVVEDKQRRQAARRRRAADKRREAEAERQARAVLREQQREGERQARLLEKKARKAAEREGNRSPSDALGQGPGKGQLRQGRWSGWLGRLPGDCGDARGVDVHHFVEVRVLGLLTALQDGVAASAVEQTLVHNPGKGFHPGASQILLQGGRFVDRRGFGEGDEEQFREVRIAEPREQVHHRLGLCVPGLALEFALVGFTRV